MHTCWLIDESIRSCVLLQYTYILKNRQTCVWGPYPALTDTGEPRVPNHIVTTELSWAAWNPQSDAFSIGQGGRTNPCSRASADTEPLV
jgi:hypothetical protein